MRPILVFVAAALVLPLAILTAAAGSNPVIAQAGPTPTHIQVVAPGPATMGTSATIMGVLHDNTTNQGIRGMTLVFSMKTVFGWLNLGNRTTDDSGKAALDFQPVEPGTFTVRVAFDGNGTYAPTNRTSALTILPTAPANSPGLPPETIIVSIILLVVGGVWVTYGFVAWQVAGIRSDRPEKSEEDRRKSSKAEVNETMEDESGTPKRVPRSANVASRTVLIVAVVALVLGGLALAFAGVQTLAKTPAYTPQTVNLQIAIVADLQGEGWDVWLPNQLTVHVGDTVRLNILNADEMEHGFKLTAFNVDKPLPAAAVDAGGNITPSQTLVTFTPDQAGSFEFKCNIPCGPGHDYMIGTLVVLPD